MEEKEKIVSDKVAENDSKSKKSKQKTDDISNVKKSGLKAIDIAYIGLASALIAICSWISIPYTVPFTLQTFAVFTVVGILGVKRGTLSVLVYILIGAVGVPVFSGFKGGVSALFGTTGGYIVGFIFLSLIAGLIIDKFGKKIYVMCIGMILGLIVCYAFGTAWFMYVYMRNTGAVGIATVLGWCVVPYIVPDLVKMALAIAISTQVAPRIKIKG